MELFLKMLIVILSNIVNGSNHKKCSSLNKPKRLIQATLLKLHLHANSQEFHYYSFEVEIYRCVGSCNTLNDLSNKVCVAIKTSKHV